MIKEKILRKNFSHAAGFCVQSRLKYKKNSDPSESIKFVALKR